MMCWQQSALPKGQRGWAFYHRFTCLSFNGKAARGASLKACSGLAVSEGQEQGEQSQVGGEKKCLQMVLKCK